MTNSLTATPQTSVLRLEEHNRVHSLEQGSGI